VNVPTLERRLSAHVVVGYYGARVASDVFTATRVAIYDLPSFHPARGIDARGGSMTVAKL